MLPLIFLMVAAFILNVALTRALALQRPQIAALKALGYGNTALGWHYLKWALLIGAGGVVIGIAAGAWLGSAIGELYNEFFRFPDLLFRVSARVVARRHHLTLAAAAPAPSRRVRRAVRVPPAEAMRPEAPARYRPERASRRRASRAASAPPDAWCCATSRGIRCARPARSSASPSPSRS